VTEFENALERTTGATHAVAVNSGTAALHCAYYALGIKPGDNIVTSPLTFAATANAARYLGADVKFADVANDTGCIDPACVENTIDANTKAIVAVDYAGHPADYDALRIIAKRSGIALIADAAHSLGGRYKGAPVGNIADASIISFHPVKPITSGEGGAILTSDASLADKMARFRTHGITRDRSQLRSDPGPWHQEMQDLGYNYRITDFQCALATSQLSRLQSFINRRESIAAAYSSAFENVPQITTPTLREGYRSGWHLYVIRVAPNYRKDLFIKLRELGVGVQVHYLPVHRHPYYADLGYEPDQCPVANAFYSGAISLPIYPRMTDDDVTFCIKQVTRAITEIF